ncbi:MAG TPA: hypothetical protein VJ964_06835 [Balneolaceae bacterium]|nr:hypothetical protein [Balneolaceae bacterium]
MMRDKTYDSDPDPVFHERIHVLTKRGYRGFNITKNQQHWDGVKVTASNHAGKIVSSSGATEQEALKKLIDQIDLILDR